MDIPHEEMNRKTAEAEILRFRPIIYGHTSRRMDMDTKFMEGTRFPTYHLWTYLTKTVMMKYIRDEIGVSDLSFMDIPHEENESMLAEVFSPVSDLSFMDIPHEVVGSPLKIYSLVFPTYHLWTYLTKAKFR